MIDRFNIRVYGILVQDNKILLSEEEYKGRHLVKFPGGGLEYGEGLLEALIRECQEELNCRVEVGELYFVTDYFIQSAFIETDQIISFYYLISTEDKITESSAEHKIVWIDPDPNQSNYLTFPQDRDVFVEVCSMISNGN